MKTLFLLRHAKSSWDTLAMRDFDRPLNQRGLRAAPVIGRYLRKRGAQPDMVISSPAERARQTTLLVVEAAGISAEIRFDERIYEATTDRLMEVITEIEDSANEILLIGHNLGMEQLLARLTGEIHHMPTASLARIVLPVEHWNKVKSYSGRLDWIVKPKELTD